LGSKNRYNGVETEVIEPGLEFARDKIRIEELPCDYGHKHVHSLVLRNYTQTLSQVNKFARIIKLDSTDVPYNFPVNNDQ
jgi:hypothetical protein